MKRYQQDVQACGLRSGQEAEVRRRQQEQHPSTVFLPSDLDLCILAARGLPWPPVETPPSFTHGFSHELFSS